MRNNIENHSCIVTIMTYIQISNNDLEDIIKNSDSIKEVILWLDKEWDITAVSKSFGTLNF